MLAGVPVIAAAEGQVTAVRDGMPDRVHRPGADELAGRDCGNGVVIDHGNGWETQYCHLRQGTLAVRPGKTVQAGTPLGEVGLSGRTQFPHLHLSVRRHGRVIDPFAPDQTGTCGPSANHTLWESDVPYRPSALLSLGFAGGIPEFSRVQTGGVRIPTPRSDALVLFGFAFGGQPGDVMRLHVALPDGTVLIDEALAVDRAQAQYFRAAGKRRRTERWPAGSYTGTAELLRNGEVLDRRIVHMTLP